MGYKAAEMTPVANQFWEKDQLTIAFQANMSNICWFQHLKREEPLLFFVIYDGKWRVSFGQKNSFEDVTLGSVGNCDEQATDMFSDETIWLFVAALKDVCRSDALKKWKEIKSKSIRLKTRKSSWMDVTSIQNWINSTLLFSRCLQCKKDDADLSSYASDMWETGKAFTLDINSQQLSNILNRDFKPMPSWGTLICRFTAVYCQSSTETVKRAVTAAQKIYVTLMEVYITQRTTSNCRLKPCFWVLRYVCVRC